MYHADTLPPSPNVIDYPTPTPGTLPPAQPPPAVDYLANAQHTLNYLAAVGQYYGRGDLVMSAGGPPTPEMQQTLARLASLGRIYGRADLSDSRPVIGSEIRASSY